MSSRTVSREPREFAAAVDDRRRRTCHVDHVDFTSVPSIRSSDSVPASMARKNAKGTKEPPSDQPEISEEEQWRIINETGLLKQMKTSPPTAQAEKPEETPFAEEILNAMLLIAPFTFLLIMMDM